MIPAIDRRAVGAGAGVAVVIGFLAIVSWQLIDAVADLGDQSNWVFAFAAVVAAGWVAGGFVAARRSPDAPYTHGIFAALASYILIAAVGVAVNLATGGGTPYVALVLFAIVSAFFGILGALVTIMRLR